MSAELRMVEGENVESDPLAGTTIDGRYEVEKVLGEGGMGLVYKARHIVLNKPLAIKVLRPDVSRDEEIITRFRQEAQSASAIGNQHIIDISDFGVLPDNSTYFVMEFLDGVDLTGAIERDERIDTPVVVHIAKQLCRALGAAHDAGIVHRDLKPDNIYLIRRGGDSAFVKVLDFGIAKVGGNSSKLTRAGQVFGTPHYMSPEQCAGSGVDHRTDIYALGIILYEMCTGMCPFDADNLMGILTKHLYEEPVPPRQHAPEIPEELEFVILRAMAKKADERYQTMGELLADLERLEAGTPTVARESTQSVTLPTQEVAAPKSKVGLILGALVLLIAGGVGAFVALGPSDTPEQPLTPTVDEALPPVDETPPAEVESPPEQVGAATPEVVMVEIQSEPAGAELWRGEELLGNTPLSIERPTGEDRVQLTLSRVGFQDREFTISASTATSVNFALAEEVRTPSRMRGSTMRRRPPQETAMETMTTMMAPATVMHQRPPSEVLNPWGNN